MWHCYHFSHCKNTSDVATSTSSSHLHLSLNTWPYALKGDTNERKPGKHVPMSRWNHFDVYIYIIYGTLNETRLPSAFCFRMLSFNSVFDGMKEIVRSFSKRASCTHWWNLMSWQLKRIAHRFDVSNGFLLSLLWVCLASISTDLPLATGLPVASFAWCSLYHDFPARINDARPPSSSGGWKGGFNS